MRGVGVGAAGVGPSFSVLLLRWLCSAPLCNASTADKEFSSASFQACALTPKHGSTHQKVCISEQPLPSHTHTTREHRAPSAPEKSNM